MSSYVTSAQSSQALTMCSSLLVLVCVFNTALATNTASGAFVQFHTRSSESSTCSIDFNKYLLNK